MSERAHAAVKKLDVSKVRTAPGVAIVLTAKEVPGVNDVSPFAGDDPMFADGLVQYYGQSLFAVAADTMAQARAAARLAVVEYEDRPALLTVDQAMEAKSFLEPPYTMQRGDAKAAHRRRPARARGPHVYRRAGAFLPGRAGRLRRAGRGRRRDGPLLLAAPERDPAQGRARAGRAEPRRHGRDAPHGRRLRRQGEPGQSAGCRRGAGRQADRPARQVLLRPRRRHDHHRQAARLPHRLSRRLRRGGAHPGHRVRAGRRAAACRSTCPSPSPTAPCSTPTTPTICRPRASPPTAARRTPSPTPPSAASAARRAWWRWSG